MSLAVHLLPMYLLCLLISVVVTEGRSVTQQLAEEDAEPESDYQLRLQHYKDALGDGYEPRHRRSEDREMELATPWVGLGVLSDMQQFFENLRTNLDSLETLPPDERDALMGKTQPQLEKDQYMRPAATAAYLHAMRNQRPSYKIRNFVESPEPVTLRGTNHYDPSLLWTGLGRR